MFKAQNHKLSKSRRRFLLVNIKHILLMKFVHPSQSFPLFFLSWNLFSLNCSISLRRDLECFLLASINVFQLKEPSSFNTTSPICSIKIFNPFSDFLMCCLVLGQPIDTKQSAEETDFKRIFYRKII